MNLKETEYDGVDWIQLVYDNVKWRALVNAVMNIWASQKYNKFLTT
jgi:hypothetical protein